MYTPRHARLSCVPARAAVGTTLTAVLLPLALAGPAFAQEAAPSSSTTSATSTATVQEPSRQSTTMRISATPVGSDGHASIGVRLLADERAVPDTLVDVEALTDGTWTSVAQIRTNARGLAYEPLPFAESTRIRATYAGDSSRTSGVSPEIDVARRSTTMRISATRVGSDGRAAIGVRLLADERAVPDTLVDVESLTDGTWTSVAQIRTNAQGLAHEPLPFAESTRIRATYAGDLRRTSGISPEIDVVRQQVTTMRISASQTGSDGKARIGVRLLADGRGFPNGYIKLEAKTGSGWTYIGRLLSNSEGLGIGQLPFDRDTRIRATYAGSSTRSAGATPEIVVKANTLGERAVQIAAQQQGKPYRYGATGPSSFDCSGFTTYIYKTRLGKNIPRTSAQQEAALPRVPQSAKRPGDLLFFRSGGRVSHVGVYAGGGKMWAAPTTGDRVKLQAIYTNSYTVGRVS